MLCGASRTHVTGGFRRGVGLALACSARDGVPGYGQGMTIPALTSSGGAGLRIRIAGIPVRFDTWFFIIGVLLSIRAGVAVVVLWLVVLGGSVLVHEMGHALVARTTGAQPEIVIHALGGLTTWIPSGEVSRSRRVAISLAGPAAGIALGLMFVAAHVAGLGDAGGLRRLAIDLAIRVNILYGVFNLLPILPLDGGQTLRDLLPGGSARRERTAAIVSIVVGAGAIAGALYFKEPFAAVFVAFFMVGNFASLRAGRPASPPRPRRHPAALAEAFRLYEAGALGPAADAAELAAAAADSRGDHAVAVEAVQLAAQARLESGSPGDAKRLLLDLPVGSVRPLLEGRVLLATGQPELGVERLAVAFASAPADQAAFHLANGLVRTGALDRLVATFTDASLPPSIVLAAARGALDAGGASAAGRLAEAAGSRASGPEFGFAAFLAARAWATAGENERALLALGAAIAADAEYAAAAGTDPAFAVLRGPDYDQIVRR